MTGLIELSPSQFAQYNIEKQQIHHSHVLSCISGISNIEGQTFLIEEAAFVDKVYDRSNPIDTLAEYLYEIDLDKIPNGLGLSRLAVSIMEEEEYEYADELCLIISTWNSVDALRRLTRSPALGLEFEGTYKIQDQKTVQLFNILEQDYRRPRLRRFTVFVCKLHRGVRV